MDPELQPQGAGKAHLAEENFFLLYGPGQTSVIVNNSKLVRLLQIHFPAFLLIFLIENK